MLIGGAAAAARQRTTALDGVGCRRNQKAADQDVKTCLDHWGPF